MTNLAFDTHKFVMDLTKAKMPQAQAEALANHYASLLDDRLATKDDIKQLASDIKQLESNVGKDIESAAKTLWIKMLIAQFVMTGLIIAALSLGIAMLKF